jgi:hypothetical protein
MAEKVTVEALKPHTNAGESYDVGDTYDVDHSAVENLAVQGMAVRTDRVAHAKALKSTAKGKLQPVKAKKARTGKK